MTNMMCADDIVVRFDASNLVSVSKVELGNVLGVQASRTQSSFVVELGKKLLHSAREGDTAAVLDLMGKGAPFTTDWLGTSPLHLAAMNDHVSTCDVLLRAGISRDTRTKVERTPLHLAAYEGHARVCALLLQHGADVDCRDMLKMTPLHWAVEKGHEGCVDYLLEYGADPKAVSKFKKTPISIAMEMKRPDFVKKLKNALINKINNEQLKDTLKATESIAVQNKSEPSEIILDDTNYENNTHLMEMEDESREEKTVEVEPHTVLENLLPQEVDEASNAATVQLLRQHGITMLPADNTNTVMSALQSGRTIVLSDAGKLMLKDTSIPNNIQKPIQIKKNPVILQTAKLKNASLSQGKVKIYTLNSNQLMAMTNQKGLTNMNNAKVSQKVPIDTLKKAVTSAGINFVQIPKTNKVINVSPQKPTFQLKAVSPAKTLNNNMQTKKSAVLNISQLQNLQKDGIIHLKNATGLPSGVKIVMNKSNLGKIISTGNNKVQMINVNDIKLKAASIANATTENNNTATKFSLNLDRDRSKNMEQLKSELVNAQKEIAEQKQLIEDKNKEIEALKERLLLYESQCID